MSIKALSRKIERLNREERRNQGRETEVEFVVYTYDNPPPPGTEVDFVIDFGLAFLSEEEQEEILRQRNCPFLEVEDDA